MPHAPSTPRFKVCCIQDAAEMEAAAAAGATFAGLVAAMPGGPGVIADRRIAELVAAAPAGLRPVLLTARSSARAIVAHLDSTGAPAVQIVRHVAARVRHEIRDARPDVTILQVVHVEGPASLDAAVALAEGADHLLLDSGRPGAPVPELGGTGRTHDWATSGRIVEAVEVPVLLAGGLGPDNVAEAVAAVAPWGVDVCSGLRNGSGALDRDRLARFAAALGAGDAAPEG